MGAPHGITVERVARNLGSSVRSPIHTLKEISFKALVRALWRTVSPLAFPSFSLMLSVRMFRGLGGCGNWWRLPVKGFNETNSFQAPHGITVERVARNLGSSVRSPIHTLKEISFKALASALWRTVSPLAFPSFSLILSVRMFRGLGGCGNWRSLPVKGFNETNSFKAPHGIT